MACPNVESCSLFPLLKMTLQTWRTMYCDDPERYAECARFILRAKGEPVPDAMLPNGKHLRPQK